MAKGSKRPCYVAKEVADQLVLDHLGIARTIALHMYNMLPKHVELDDLIHAGLMGLLDAASKYDPSKQVRFLSYAKYRIRGAIFDSLRKLDVASRELRRQLKEIETATLELYATLQCRPTEVEIAAQMHINLSQLRKLVLQGQGVTQVSTNFVLPDDELFEHESAGSPAMRPDIMCSAIQLGAALDKAMLPLLPRQQQVVQAYYKGYKTMKEIGLVLGIKESRVSQLHKSALIKMRIELVASGVLSSNAF